jgi:hypothetical protein
MAFWKSKGLLLASEEGSDFGIPYLDSADTQHARWSMKAPSRFHCGRWFFTTRFSPVATIRPCLTGRARRIFPGIYRIFCGAITQCGGFPATMKVAMDGSRALRNRYLLKSGTRALALADMTNHRFLSEDFAVEETQFSNGNSIIANFAPEPRSVEGITIAAGGFHMR